MSSELLIFTLLSGGFIMVLPRTWAALPLLVGICYVTVGQTLDIGPFHFHVFRLLIAFAWFRVLLRGEYRLGKGFNAIDKNLIILFMVTAAAYTIHSGTFAAVVYQLGVAYSALGSYFLFRFLIKDDSDVEQLYKVIILVSIPLAVAMMIEHDTGRNWFSIFGGVPEYSVIRAERIRAQGAFRHPILAGAFGALIIPFLCALWSRGARCFPLIGCVAATTIVLASASSGPVLAYLTVLAGLAAWYIRDYMRIIRWTIIGTILCLHFFIMKAPVWYLFARIDVVSGSTGWHRAELIEQAVRHLDEWWLTGTNYTAHWMPYALESNPDMADITNQYLIFGVDGGIISLMLFVLVLIRSFGGVGKALDAIPPERGKDKFFVWCGGATLFGHIMLFFSVSYFDQSSVFFYMLLAIISNFSTEFTWEKQFSHPEEYADDPFRNMIRPSVWDVVATFQPDRTEENTAAKCRLQAADALRLGNDCRIRPHPDITRHKHYPHQS